jgi:hypothetical protein
MKKYVIDRYERNADGNILIDVTATNVDDLYNHFDRSAPYIRRDLDQGLADYIIGSAKELEEQPFAICFTLANIPDEDERSHIRQSIHSFFLSLVEVERNKFRQMTHKSLIFFCIGIAILFISIWLDQKLGSNRTVIINVFAEGLTVAAWVSLWEASATFLIKWFPHRTNIHLYQRLASVPSVFRSSSQEIRNKEDLHL